MKAKQIENVILKTIKSSKKDKITHVSLVFEDSQSEINFIKVYNQSAKAPDIREDGVFLKLLDDSEVYVISKEGKIDVDFVRFYGDYILYTRTDGTEDTLLDKFVSMGWKFSIPR